EVFFPADDLAGLLVEDAACDLEWGDLFLEEALGLRAPGALLARKRVDVLRLPADLVALGDDFGRVAHHHVDAWLVLLQPRVGIGIARCIMVMLSTRPPMAASAPSWMIWYPAIAIACRPEEQKRLTVVAATVTGSPARSVEMRATFVPAGPCGWPQPRITSSISDGSSCGNFRSASLMQCAARSSGRVRLNEPRNDFANGVRELATTTASLIGDPFSKFGFPDATGFCGRLNSDFSFHFRLPRFIY